MSTHVADYLASLDVPEWDGRPHIVAEVWSLCKGDHVAVCSLATHPLGAQLRVGVDGELHRSEATRVGLSLGDLAREWRSSFQAKGWH